MKLKQKFKMFSCLAVLFIVSGCASTKARTEVKATNLAQYENIVINEVKVYSTEEAAKDNLPLQEKLKNWQSYARGELETYVTQSKYNLLNEMPAQKNTALIFDLDVNVMYGNRALRWAVGFGAGKGGVYSTLTVLDAKTGDVKFKGKAASDLSGGGAGGDIGAILKDNIKTLIAEYNKG